MQLRFNRYMVECEFLEDKITADEIAVLIDTWWNVNCQKQSDESGGFWF